ncbi:DinB family protein [Terasakiella sp. A23]|uniref:DinB family protein n=1 Tax=Terasakiella sp. FCG-A23 TaxID=3080561 RepID=UPI002954107B|nr:DinB family protein [Terasakiella sp. A23]MDV7339685.1 DinB family protein [Terasakiella sp. A23]
MDKSYFAQLAHYNIWANRRVYDVVATISEEEFKLDCDVFFKSICGTLNHILVGDIVWLARLEGTPRMDLKLNDILHEGFAALWQARKDQDAKILSFCEGLEEAFLETDLQYKSIISGEYEAPVKMILGHMFNHQTHHRGHVHAALTRLSKPTPDIDLIYYTLGC